MARNKDKAYKIKLQKAKKEAKASPFWARLRALGRRRTNSWRLNPQKRRKWKRNRIGI